MADMRISELTTAAGLHDGDLFETSQTDSISSSGYASYKTSLNAIAAFIAKQVQFSGDLQTTSKTLIGAINEVFNAGTSVTVTNVLPATETTKRVATITVDGVAKDINADDTVKVITDLKTPKSATITNGIAQFDCIEENLVKGLKVTMNPIQDLHGYSNPWAGGAGKNKLIYPYKSGTKTDHDVTFTVNSDGTVDLSGTSSGYAEFVFQSRLDGTLTLPAGSYILSGGINYDIYLSVANSSGTNLGYDRGSGLTFTLDTEQAISVWIGIAGSVNTNGKKIEPMLRLSTVTDVTFAPYENICPISGRTEASVTRTGKNILYKTIEGVTIGTNGAISANSSYNIVIAQVLQGKTYTFSLNGVASVAVRSFFTAEPASGSSSYNGERYTTDNTFVSPITGYVAIRTSTNATNIQLENGSTATEYTPYVETETHTHQYSETIYGGVDDFVNGGATSTMGMVDLGDLTWTYYTAGDNPIFYASVSDTKIYERYESIASVKCSNYKNSGTANQRTALTSLLANGDFSFISGTANFVIRDDNYTSASDFKTAMNGVQLCYELATPTTIETSAEEITTVASTNIISGTEPISECKYTELATVDDLIKIIGGQ